MNFAPRASLLFRVNGLTPRAGPSRIVVILSGRIDRAGTPGLCDRIRAVLEDSDAELIVCDVGSLVDPDVVTVGALARLQLTARRLGCWVRLDNACGTLTELLDLMGLSDVLPLAPYGEEHRA
jgi:ABC-type transporter Mla MlaB component